MSSRESELFAFDFIDRDVIEKKRDSAVSAIQEIEANLENSAGMTEEARKELQMSWVKFQEDIALLSLKLTYGAQMEAA